jgi:hypothetical protein
MVCRIFSHLIGFATKSFLPRPSPPKAHLGLEETRLEEEAGLRRRPDRLSYDQLHGTNKAIEWAKDHRWTIVGAT